MKPISHLLRRSAGRLLYLPAVLLIPAMLPGVISHADAGTGCQVLVINDRPTELCPGDVYNSRTGLHRANPEQPLARGIPRPLRFPVSVEVTVDADALRIPVNLRATAATSADAIEAIKARRSALVEKLTSAGYPVESVEFQNVNLVRGPSVREYAASAYFMIATGSIEDVVRRRQRVSSIAGVKDPGSIAFALSAKGKQKAIAALASKAIEDVRDKAEQRAALFGLRVVSEGKADIGAPGTLSADRSRFKAYGMGTVEFATVPR